MRQEILHLAVTLIILMVGVPAALQTILTYNLFVVIEVPEGVEGGTAQVSVYTPGIGYEIKRVP